MGSMGTAFELDREELSAQRRSWIDMMNSLTLGDYRAALNAAEALSDSREESLRFLAWVETWYRDLLVHALTQETRELINLDMLPQIQRQSGTAKLDSILLSLSQIAGATARIQRNLNRRMVLEALFIGAVEAR
jgi:DNA polymerase III gamma/tau subunit